MKDQREFARVIVSVNARFRVLDNRESQTVRERVLRGPTVWSPPNESRLRDLATSVNTGEEGILAQAVLELATQVVQLQSVLAETNRPMESARVIQLSGGGGQIITPSALEFGSMFELRLHGNPADVPPLTAIGEVVHRYGSDFDTFGFRFAAIHRADRERLIRFLYKEQRRCLREAHEAEG